MEHAHKQALIGHRWVISKIILLHLPMPALAFAIDYMDQVIVACLILSALFTFLLTKGLNAKSEDDFVLSHWQTAIKRSHYLLYGYVVAVIVMGIGWLISINQTEQGMKEILFSAFTHLATLPILFPAIFVFFLQAISIAKAKKGLKPTTIF